MPLTTTWVILRVLYESMKKQIDTISGGRFISHHPGKVDVYYDNRGRVIKCDGIELVEDLLPER